MGKITVFNNGLRKGSTSLAFDVETKKELMREHTLSFSILNNNPIYKEITTKSVFQNKGQLFDVTGIDTESGADNITSVSAEHVSYRLSKYPIPANYSFVGTIEEIAQDILNLSGASAEFSVGECFDKGFLSFSLENEQETSARAAIFGMKALGVEIDYDNFKINIPESVGIDSGKTFRFGVDLQSIRRRWQLDNGWTYDVAIADVQKIADNENFEFSIGDYVTVEDSFIGDSFKKRIIAYNENDDDPSKNTITLGVFIRDNATTSIETNRVANAANDTANNSVQLGSKYNNLSITHENGFEVITLDNNKRLLMNGQDGFAVQVRKNGEWVTVTSTEEWGVLTPRLTTQTAKDEYYATVGTNEEGNVGFFLYRFIDGNWVRHLDIWTSDANNTVIESKFGDLTLQCPPNQNVAFERKGKGGYGINGSVDTGTKKLTFANGILEETADSDSGIKVFKSASGNSVIENTANENLVLVVPDGKAVQFKHKNGNYYGETGTLTLPGTNVSMTFECGLLTAIGRWE